MLHQHQAMCVCAAKWGSINVKYCRVEEKMRHWPPLVSPSDSCPPSALLPLDNASSFLQGRALSQWSGEADEKRRCELVQDSHESPRGASHLRAWRVNRPWQEPEEDPALPVSISIKVPGLNWESGWSTACFPLALYWCTKLHELEG